MPTEQPLKPNQFRAKDGNVYTLEFDYQLARELKSEAGINVLELEDGQAFRQLAASREDQAEVVWRLVEQQCEKTYSLTQEDFFRSIGPDEIEALNEALLAAMVGFTRKSLRPALRAMIDASRTAEEETANKAAESLTSGAMGEAIRNETNRLIEAAEASIPGGSASS